MTRITKEMTSKIAEKAAVKSGVVGFIEAEKKDRFAWAERVRVFAIGGEQVVAAMASTVKKVDSLRESLPKGIDRGSVIIRTNSYISVNLAGVRVSAEFESLKVTPWEVTIMADNELVQAFYDLEARREYLIAQLQTIKAQVTATVSQFTTVKKLVEAWPEVVELLPPTVETNKSNLPAIQVSALNALVGLPSKEVELK